METWLSTNARASATSHVANTTVRQKSIKVDGAPHVPTVIGIVIATTIILLSLTLLLTLTIVIFQRKTVRKQINSDSPYSTLCRQKLQSQSLHTPNDLYDHIKLSPSTGQAEFISKTETDNPNNPSPHYYHSNVIPSVDKGKPRSAQPVSNISLSINTSEQPTYAVVNKVKKHKHEKESEGCSSKTTDGSLTEQITAKGKKPIGSKHLQQSGALSLDSSDEYCTVKKERSINIVTDEQKVSSIPPQNVEDLYTVVQKKTHTSKVKDEENTPPIPQRTTEELYTAAVKKTEGNSVADKVESPQIPPHTVEELYTAVMKKPKARETDYGRGSPTSTSTHSGRTVHSCAKEQKMNL